MPVARATPLGTMLDDGYSTKIALTNDSNISFFEKTVKPPGLDGGDAIDITTMHNSTYRTMAARSLITLTENQATVAYDPAVYPLIIGQLNVNQLITVHFPNSDTLDFYGFLKSFEFSDNTEGEHPEATIVIVPTNVHSSTGAETAPVMTSADTS